jgi:hypothetical protein
MCGRSVKKHGTKSREIIFLNTCIKIVKYRAGSTINHKAFSNIIYCAFL